MHYILKVLANLSIVTVYLANCSTIKDDLIQQIRNYNCDKFECLLYDTRLTPEDHKELLDLAQEYENLAKTQVLKPIELNQATILSIWFLTRLIEGKVRPAYYPALTHFLDRGSYVRTQLAWFMYRLVLNTLSTSLFQAFYIKIITKIHKKNYANALSIKNLLEHYSNEGTSCTLFQNL